MINKLKYLFLLVLCALLIGGTNVSAQTGAKATEADVEGMIEFYEWAFETDFTPAQRAQFQQLLEQDFRDDAAKARRDTNTVVEGFAKIKQMNAESRRETRKAFLDDFLADLKKHADSDGGASFLLEIYRSAHNGSDEFTAMDAATGNVFDKRVDKVTNSDGTPDVVGKWMRSTGSGSIDYTGKTQYKSGESFTFEFLPDGRVNYVYDKDVLSIMQCKIKETGKASGTFTISGDTMTINLGAMTSVGSSTCDKKDNFNRTSPAATITKNFTVKRMDSITRPDNPVILCFDGQSDDSCFEKTKN